MPCNQHSNLQIDLLSMEMEADSRECQVPQSGVELETQNKATVAALYKALAEDDREMVTKLLVSDLEWWFHGPPGCQHMMRVLTGESNRVEFRFDPRSIEVVGNCVIAEGWEGAPAYWVHVWTLKDGLITQFREYFNTWITVTDLRPTAALEINIAAHQSHTLWQSQPRDLARRSLPGLVLAI